MGSDPEADLEVTYILATDPGQSYSGQVRRIALTADVDETEGGTVQVIVEVDKENLAARRPGATVVARIHCGRRPLGYVWFHDVWEFVQTRVLFRIW